MARSRNVCTSPLTLTARYIFTAREHMYGELMSPTTIKCTSVFMRSARFPPNLDFLDKFFAEVPNTNLHGNPSSGSRPRIETDGRMGMAKLRGAFHDVRTRCNSASGCLPLHVGQSPKLCDSEKFRVPATAIYDMTLRTVPDKHRRFRRTLCHQQALRKI